MKEKAIFMTRSNISLCSKNTNVYRKALEVATKYDATLYVSASCSVPREIAEKYAAVVRFRRVWDILSCIGEGSRSDVEVFTGFDFPCMYVGWQLKKRYGCKWAVFLWDPPCLSHRDGFPPLRWAIDALFRFFAKRCDRLVLNIHPGLLDEIGYKPREGQVELRMQDAFADVSLPSKTNDVDYEYDFGVLAKWKRNGGAGLLAEAMSQMKDKSCLWIGDVIDKPLCDNIKLANRLSQDEAFERLHKCRVLIAPYPPKRVYKWNYPLKVFEYLQLGRPIIASDNPGVVDVANRWPGRISLFKSGDVGSLVSVMRKLLG